MGLTERDDATGLDSTWFRKNENRAGRWTSPDPYNASASIGDPQSFNKYSYVQNQPTNFIDPSGLLWRYFDVSQGMGCVLMGDGIFHCTEYINRYWYDDGIEAGGGGGGGGIDSGGGVSDKDRVKNQLDFYLQVKSLACEKALKALRVTDQQLLNGFDRNRFVPGVPKNGAEASTTFPLKGPGPTRTVSRNGVTDFSGYTGFLIHELAHAVQQQGDPGLYTTLLKAQAKGNISGLPVLGNRISASEALSKFLNKACGFTDGVDSPMPNRGNGSTSA